MLILHGGAANNCDKGGVSGCILSLLGIEHLG